MSYFPEIDNATAVFTEFLATSHTANNSKIIWNTTPRSTGTTGVSIDSSGNITLGGGAFWLIASLDVTRANTGLDVNMHWQDATETTISTTQGASHLIYNIVGSPTANAVGMFVANVAVNGSRTISLKYTGTSNLTINTTMSLLVIEMRR